MELLPWHLIGGGGGAGVPSVYTCLGYGWHRDTLNLVLYRIDLCFILYLASRGVVNWPLLKTDGVTCLHM